MGVVFAATHLRLAQTVAIEMLLPEWMSEPSLVERFAREGRASAGIRSEHIVRVLDVDECDGVPYLVLEYLEGQDFDVLLSEQGAMPVNLAIDLVLQACEGLAEAHAVGTIHRDLKPANLFLTTRADGSACVKVLDFGISKILSSTASPALLTGGTTQPLTVMGSPKYMSPEQMQSATDVDERTDIWALGAILYELLTGSPPFTGETITEVCARVMSDPPPPLEPLRSDVSPGLEAAMRHCLEKDREWRYANAAELAQALAPFGSDAARESAARIARILGANTSRTSSERPISAKDRLTPEGSLPQGIHRPIAGYILAGAAALAVGCGIGWMFMKQEMAIRGAAHDAPSAEQVVTAPVDIPAIPAIPPPAASASASAPATIASAASVSSTTIAAALAPAPPPAPSAAASPPPRPRARSVRAVR